MNVLVFPRSTNPYQDLLYGNLSAFPDFRYSYITFRITRWNVLNSVLFPFVLMQRRLTGYGIIHIHWLYELGDTGGRGFSRRFFSLYAVAVLAWMKFLRYRIVYTLHDNPLTDTGFSSPKKVAEAVVRYSDALIALSETTVRTLENSGLSIREKTTVIPHGNYIPWYPKTTNRHRARTVLGIPDDAFVFLFFGILRPYKGVDALLRSLRKRHEWLLVAGACYDTDIALSVDAYARENGDRCICHVRHIDAAEVQTYFTAADCAVFPYGEITNSGSAMLAASFACPFIAPASGSLRDFPRTAALLYDPTDPHGLDSALAEAVRKRKALPGIGRSAHRYARSVSWETIATGTLSVYRGLPSTKH